MTTDRTITGKHARELLAGNIIVRNPDGGDSGRWTVTSTPTKYPPYVRIDAYDEENRRDVVWVRQGSETVVVELAGRELQLRAAELLSILMSEDLPDVYSWEINEDGVRGMLRYAPNDKARAGLDTWRQRLGEAVTLDEVPTSDRGAQLTVSGVLDSVPVTVWASVLRTSEPTSTNEGQAAADEQDAEATA